MVNPEPNDSGSFPFDRQWSIEQALPLACLLEAAAPKLGNVHPQAMFEDMHFGHFLASALCLPSQQHLEEQGVGSWVELAVQAVQSHVGINTNLGTLLLLGPLAKAAASTSDIEVISWQESVHSTLEQLTPDDSRCVYSAIRNSSAGGLNEQSAGDVHGEAPDDLLEAMQRVAGFDAVARQYVNGFTDVFERLLPWFLQALRERQQGSAQSIPASLAAIVDLQVRWLATEPDGLIVRKEGAEVAGKVQQLAVEAMNSAAARVELEDYLIGDGNRRNPGTTADLIAATLFVALVLGPVAVS